MMQKTKMLKLLFTLAVVLGAIRPCSAQTENPQPTSYQVQVSSEVRDIMKESLSRGDTILPDGTHVSTWVPPSEADTARIHGFGDAAVQPLSEYLKSNEPRAQLLAVRFLGAVGGPAIVPPLKLALDPARWVVVRTQALSSLMAAPSAQAILIIEHILETDPSPLVQQRAKQILATYGKSGSIQR